MFASSFAADTAEKTTQAKSFGISDAFADTNVFIRWQFGRAE